MNTILLGFIGPWQIALIVAIVLLLFGGKKNTTIDARNGLWNQGV